MGSVVGIGHGKNQIPDEIEQAHSGKVWIKQITHQLLANERVDWAIYPCYDN